MKIFEQIVSLMTVPLVQGTLAAVPRDQVGPVLEGLCHAQSAQLTGFRCGDVDACREEASCDYPTRGWPTRNDSISPGLEESVIAGCAGEDGCGDLPTTAIDPDGHAWGMPDTCAPIEW